MCRKKITTVSEFSPRAEGGPVRPREEKGVARFVGRRGLYTVRPRGRRGGNRDFPGYSHLSEKNFNFNNYNVS
jgi:hypothetical protein